MKKLVIAAVFIALFIAGMPVFAQNNRVGSESPDFDYATPK